MHGRIAFLHDNTHIPDTNLAGFPETPKEDREPEIR